MNSSTAQHVNVHKYIGVFDFNNFFRGVYTSELKLISMPMLFFFFFFFAFLSFI